MLKTVLINILVVVVSIVLLASWCEYRARTLAERAVHEQEQRELSFWRERLVPLYREMGIDHKENPATKAELFDPLVKSLESYQERGD